MIITKTGNVLDVTEGIIVHGCNMEGVMGAGIAKEVKERFPEAFEVYSKSNRQLGEITIWPVTKKKLIVNAITQDLVTDRGIDGRRVSYDAIQNCFEYVRALQTSIAGYGGCKLPVVFPLIGAGLGGGDWRIIYNIIDITLGPDIVKELYVLPCKRS